MPAKKHSPLLHRALPLVVIAGAALIPYLHTLDYGWHFDDRANIVDRPALRLEQLGLAGLRRAATEGLASNRPVANVSFALNHLAGGYAPRGYHLVNIAIHVLNALLVYLVLRLLLAAGDRQQHWWSQSQLTWVAAAAALLWATHPLQSQSITYIVQRMTSLATLFYLAALAAYLVARRRGKSDRLGIGLGVASCGCWLLAVASKEIAITLPVLVLVLEWFLYRDLDLSWLQRSARYWLIVVIGLGVLGYIYVGGRPMAVISGTYDQRDFTMGERLLTESRIVIDYLSLFFWPLPGRLNLDHDVIVSTSLLSPLSTLFSVLAIAAALAAAVWLAPRQRLLSLAIIWYFLNLALESSFLGLELMFEHRMYLPSIGVVLLVVVLLFGLHREQWAAKLTGCVVIAGALAAATWQRNYVWKSDLTLWRDCLAKSPRSARSHNNLGRALWADGDTAAALPHLQQAVVSQPEEPQYRYNLAVGLQSAGDLTGAAAQFAEAVELHPEFHEARVLLAGCYTAEGRLDEAYTELLKVQRLAPDAPKLAHNLSYYWHTKAELAQAAGDHQEAAAAYRRALAVQASPALHLGLGKTLLRLAQGAAAAEQFRLAIALTPDDAAAHDLLGYALQLAGDGTASCQAFERAVRLAPDNALYRNNLALAWRRAGKTEQATAAYREAIRLDPANPEARNNLGALLLDQGQPAEAAEQFRLALEARPESASYQQNLQRALAAAGKQAAANQAAAQAAQAQQLLRQGKFAEAAAAYEAVLAVGAGDAAVNHGYGIALMQTGRLEEAVKAYRASLAMRPDQAPVLNNLGATLGRLGRLEEAATAFRAAVAAEPDYADAQENLEAVLRLQQRD